MTTFGDQLLDIGAAIVVMWRASRMLTVDRGDEAQLLIDHGSASWTKSLPLDNDIHLSLVDNR